MNFQQKGLFMNIGVYPGSFDPITIGHVDVIKKALTVCDEVHVVVANNMDKKHMFSFEERTKIVIDAVENIDVPEGKKVIVVQFGGIVSLYAKKIEANIMIRGLRNHVDLNYEQNLEQFTKRTNYRMVTMYFSAEPEHMFTSSSLVRNFIATGFVGKLNEYIPEGGHQTVRDFIRKEKDRFVKTFPTEAVFAFQKG